MDGMQTRPVVINARMDLLYTNIYILLHAESIYINIARSVESSDQTQRRILSIHHPNLIYENEWR
jgi:hypothetical protein